MIKEKYYPWTIISLTIVFIFIGNYIFMPAVFDNSFGSLLLQTFLAVLGMLALPLAAIKYLFKKDWHGFGWAWPQLDKKTWRVAIGMVLANLLLLFWLAHWPEFESNYRIYSGSNLFFIASAILSLAYYLAEEFLFRGFLFLGLKTSWGNQSYWLTSLVFALFHIGKSLPEAVYAFFLSWPLCWLTYKSKSVWPAVIIHFLAALTLNILVNYLI